MVVSFATIYTCSHVFIETCHRENKFISKLLRLTPTEELRRLQSYPSDLQRHPAIVLYRLGVTTLASPRIPQTVIANDLSN